MLALLRAVNTAFQRNRSFKILRFYPSLNAQNPTKIVYSSSQENGFCLRWFLSTFSDLSLGHEQDQNSFFLR